MGKTLEALLIIYGIGCLAAGVFGGKYLYNKYPAWIEEYNKERVTAEKIEDKRGFKRITAGIVGGLVINAILILPAGVINNKINPKPKPYKRYHDGPCLSSLSIDEFQQRYL